MPEQKNNQARDKLIGEYKIYVRNLAYRLVRMMGLPMAQVDEYVAAGYLGLVEAAERFDGSTGRPFKPFAFLRIRGAIIDSIRRTAHISGPAYRLSRALNAAQDLREELASALTSTNTVQQSSGTNANKQVRLGQILNYAADGVLVHRLSLCEAELDLEKMQDETKSADVQLENSQEQKIIRELMETLPKKERTILREHYFHGKTFIEIAEEYEGMSKSWVSRLHTRGIRRLKDRYLSILQNKQTLASFRANAAIPPSELQREHHPQS